MLDKILKVKFLKKDENISPFGKVVDVKEINIEFEGLIKLIFDVEEKHGLGKLLHKEAFTGIDYLGNTIKFNSYVLWTEEEIIKYNFDENLVPFDTEILRRKRENYINRIL